MADATPSPAEEASPAAPAPWQAPPGRAAFGFIFATVCLDMLALGIVIPVLPKLLAGFTRGDLAEAARLTGLFGTVWAAMQFLASPVLGALSDRFGRRPVILGSNFGLALDYLLMALAPTWTWLLIGRILSGLTSASYGTASAYIADVTPPEERAKRFGMLGAAFGLGFVVGPAVGGLLGAVDLRLPFWVAGGMSLINAAYGLFVLPESLPPEARSPFRLKSANPWGAMKLLSSQPLILGLSLAMLCSSLAHEALPADFVLYTQSRYGWGEGEVGIALAAVGVASTVVQALLVGKAVAWLGQRAAIALGFALGAVGFLAYGLAPTGGLFLVGVPFLALWGLAGPAGQALLSAQVGAEAQGQLQGAMASMRALTGMVGPLLFAEVLAQSLGAGPLSPWPGACFMGAALCLVAGGLLATWVTRPSAQPAAAAASGAA